MLGLLFGLIFLVLIVMLPVTVVRQIARERALAREVVASWSAAAARLGLAFIPAKSTSYGAGGPRLEGAFRGTQVVVDTMRVTERGVDAWTTDRLPMVSSIDSAYSRGTAKSLASELVCRARLRVTHSTRRRSWV